MATILLADDEPYITAVVAMKLRKLGHTVEVVDDGGRAFARLTGPGPAVDLLVTDYQMPVLSGFELCEKLKANLATSAMPVIMLSGRGHRLEPEEMARTNVRVLMAKPFSVKELAENVASLLGGAGEMKRAA